MEDIPANTELTYDYDFDYLEGSDNKCECYCGSANCSGIIGVKKKVEAPKTTKRIINKTGYSIFQSEFCKTNKTPAGTGAPSTQVDKEAHAVEEDKEAEKAARSAQLKQLKEQAKLAWEALEDAKKEEYDRKAADVNAQKLKQAQVATKKRGGKKRKVFAKAASEDDCFICRDGGDLFICDICPRAYHVECLDLQKVPSGKWKCPVHTCSVCGKKSTAHCTMCAMAFCVEHKAEGMATQDHRICMECEKDPPFELLPEETLPIADDTATRTEGPAQPEEFPSSAAQ